MCLASLDVGCPYHSRLILCIVSTTLTTHGYSYFYHFASRIYCKLRAEAGDGQSRGRQAFWKRERVRDQQEAAPNRGGLNLGKWVDGELDAWSAYHAPASLGPVGTLTVTFQGCLARAMIYRFPFIMIVHSIGPDNLACLI
jgi:hypothetical protein